MTFNYRNQSTCGAEVATPNAKSLGKSDLFKFNALGFKVLSSSELDDNPTSFNK